MVKNKVIAFLFLLSTPVGASASYYTVRYVQSTTYHEWGFFGASEEEDYKECRQANINWCSNDLSEGENVDYWLGNALASACWELRPDYEWNARTCLWYPGSEEPDPPMYEPDSPPPQDPQVPPPPPPKFPKILKVDPNYVQKMESQLTCGSVIDVNRKTVGETIPIVGAPFNLYYTTEYDTANLANYSHILRFTIPVDRTQFVKLEVTRGGVTSVSNVPLVDNLRIPVIAEDLDESQLIIPEQVVHVKVPISMSYVGSSFAGTLMDEDITLGGSYNYNPKPWGLSGFTLDIHHYLDVNSGRVFYGSGRVRDVKPTYYYDNNLGALWIVPSEDRSENYIFSSNGHHVETRQDITNIRKFKFEYNSNGTLSKVVDQNLRETLFVRDSNELQKIVSPYGQETTFSYNPWGRIADIRDPMYRRYSFGYQSGVGLLAFIRYPSGRETNFEYTDLGRFVKEVHSNGGWKELSESITQGVRNVTVRTSAGVISQLKMKMGSMEETSYTGAEATGDRVKAEGYETHRFDGTFTTRNFVNDTRFAEKAPRVASESVTVGDLVRNTTFSETVTGTDILNLSSYSKSSSVNGKVYESSYLAGNKVWTSTTPLNRTSKVWLDSQGRVLKSSAPGSLPVDYSYNAFGQLQSVVQGGSSLTYAYDQNGYLSSITDQSTGRVTSYQNDLVGRVLSSKFPDLTEINYEYSVGGAISKISLPNGQEHVFERSLFDDLRSYLAPVLGGIGSSTIYHYDSDRRVTEKVLPSGRTVEFNYQSGKNRLSSIETSRGVYEYGYSTDDAHEPASVRSPDGIKIQTAKDGYLVTRLYTMDASDSPLGTIYFEYNADHALSKVGLNSLSVNVSYDLDGRISNLGGESFVYSESYTEALMQASSKVEQSLGTVWSSNERNEAQAGVTTVTKVRPVANDPSKDHMISILKSNDGSSKMTEIRGGNQTETFYNYDTNGRLTTVAKSTNGGPTAQATSYEFYPGTNNIKWYRHGAKATMGTYDAQDRLVSLTGSVTRDFTYDADGNVASISNCLGTKSFEYDEFKNLRKVTLQNGKIIEYEIDGLNRRTIKKVNGAITEYYIWYDKTRLAGVLNPDLSVRLMYVYGNHMVAPSYLIKYGQKYKIFTTPQGSVKAVYDVNGQLQQSFEYDEYGAITAATNAEFQPLGFNSGLYDVDTRLVRFGARDYDPETGRWTSKDPILFAGGDTNLYGYTFNDPINFNDPTGLDACGMNQSTGTVVCIDNNGNLSAVDRSGYSGNGAGKNNPSYQNVENTGPIPVGNYTIGPSRPGGHMGPDARLLTPTPATRASFPSNRNPDTFNWHGDSRSNPGGASQGCPISGPNTRNAPYTGSPFDVNNISF